MGRSVSKTLTAWESEPSFRNVALLSKEDRHVPDNCNDFAGCLARNVFSDRAFVVFTIQELYFDQFMRLDRLFEGLNDCGAHSVFAYHHNGRKLLGLFPQIVSLAFREHVPLNLFLYGAEYRFGIPLVQMVTDIPAGAEIHSIEMKCRSATGKLFEYKNRLQLY